MVDQGTNLSLYRRWRPQRFAEVVGQELVAGTLRRAVAQGKPGHAYLFAGQRGVGKTSVARIFARAVNCLASEGGEPCNRCESCRRILAGRSLDVVEIDGASNRGVDQIRQLREEVAYVPAGARYKVFIIDEVHMLTGEAFNALLKTLEEPPPHVLFIFATTEPHKVPSTVLSRCQAFEFLPISEDQIAAHLRKIAAAEGIALAPGAAELIARRSGGAMRDAIVLMEQLGQGGEVTEAAVVELLGLPPLSQVDGFLAALAGQDPDRALEIVNDLAERGRDLVLFLEEAAARARDRIIAGEAQFIPVACRLIELRAELPRAFSRRLHLEVAVLELCGPPRAAAQATAAHSDPGTSGSAGAPAETHPDSGATPQAMDPVGKAWQEMLAEILKERVAVAAFLAPATATLVDGLLTIRLPADCGYHYESLLDPEVRAYVEGTAHRFFSPLLAVHIAWEGGGGAKPSLEEGARLLAQALEGTILREEDHGTR
ncbi:MAG: DNA polymerase III subunit gamma/tau [Candidatus Acetothermia bacterium]|nr:DNA polymerase III subunit gamma/tau [Candidatus Acetothermia bacterium]